MNDEVDMDEYQRIMDGAKKQKRWVQEIKFYETKSEKWEEQSKKILKRYKNVRGTRDNKTPRFNILWSNIQTLLPALYSRKPKPDIERRFRDKDDLGRQSSTALERSISYYMNEVFDCAVRSAVLDRLLPGRGSVWVRYEPHFKDAEVNENEEVADEGPQISDDVESYEAPEEAPQELAAEDVCFDYVHWQDEGHTFGRTWQEVGARWRKVYLTRKELIARFGEEIGNKITLDYSPHDLKDNKYDEVVKKGTIYEIWDKEDKKVLWIHKDYEQGPLDEQDDPLKLTDFFPSPMPMYATLGNDDMFPVPDFIEYQDQANELDELTSRIGAITKCVKVVGVYDVSAQGVDRILSEGVENTLLPISQWAIFGEKGGLKGQIDLLPMQDILQTLLGLYEARDKVKADLYEITGIADIIRGASNANETATAQQIKSQFGTLRLSANQDDVQRFVRDLVKIGTEIIAAHFGIDTIKRISGVKLLTNQEKQIVQYRQQMLQQYQQQKQANPQSPMPQLPPLPPDLQKADREDMEEFMENPTWEEVGALLKQEPTLSYKIDIETDSTIKFDQDAERSARVEFLQAAGGFLQQAMSIENPEMQPLAARMLMFGVRGFKVGKELEGAFENAISKLEKDAGQNKKPDPEMAKVQGQMQLGQAKIQGQMQLEQSKTQAQIQISQQKAQDDLKLKQAEMQLDRQQSMEDSRREDHRLQMQAQVDAHQGMIDAQVNKMKAELDNTYKLRIAEMDNANKMAIAQLDGKIDLMIAHANAQAKQKSISNA